MSMDEFNQLIIGGNVLDEKFGEREISPLFNLSMMTQKNELEFDRHMNMVTVEFIEALGRVADRIAIPHLLEEVTIAEFNCFFVCRTRWVSSQQS